MRPSCPWNWERSEDPAPIGAILKKWTQSWTIHYNKGNTKRRYPHGYKQLQQIWWRFQKIPCLPLSEWQDTDLALQRIRSLTVCSRQMDPPVFHCPNRWRWSPYCQAGQRPPETQCTTRRRKPYLKKSDCHLHATLKQRLDAVHKLRLQHDIKTLCRVLHVNRSTYYKHYHSAPAPRISENQYLKTIILHIYADYDKRLGAYKIKYILQRDYGICISVGRVYRLMKTMTLPKMSRDRPCQRRCQDQNGTCTSHLNQRCSQNAPNLVWVSDITYIKAAADDIIYAWSLTCSHAKWLPGIYPESRMPVLSWLLFRKLIRQGMLLMVLCFILTAAQNTPPFHSGSFWIPWMWYSLFRKRAIPSIMLSVNISLSTSKKKKRTAGHIKIWAI